VGIRALVENKAVLREFIEEKTFDSKSLSSMLNGAGKELAVGIRALVENKAVLKDLIEEKTFDPKSLSSMLARSGRDLAVGIRALAENKAALKELIDEKVFYPKSLSSILNGAGKDLAIGIQAIQSRLPKLQALRKTFTQTQIATKLNPVSAKRLGATIDRMFVDAMSSESNGNTVMPPGPSARSGVERLSTLARGQRGGNNGSA